MSNIYVRNIDKDTLQTVLGTDIEFEGDMYFSHPILVQGIVVGSIEVANNIFISETAKITASVQAQYISVKGNISGSLYASDCLELFSSAKVEADIQTNDLIIHSGSEFNGNCVMNAIDNTINE